HDPHYVACVVVAIPTTYADPSAFGSISPGGENLNFDPEAVGEPLATQHKVEAIRWYMATVLIAWRRAHFRHLALAGFYWTPESVSASHPLDESLIRQTADWMHHRRLRFFWIPYYGAVGVTQGRDLGFDAVMLQPNVSFHWNLPMASRFDSVAELAQSYGLGIELEAHWSVMSPDEDMAQAAQQRYFAYFTAARLYGFHRRVVTAYYGNAKSFLLASREEDPFYRRVYDRTAAYIAGSR
ncbi:MAG: DUF4855 domain-containing protein, partial [Alicyclobacillus sp.]|nr:DUF4855 domain-containing protein [Alicyclobacillus sp.]